MHDPILTDELKQMNIYWKLLVGLVNESLGIIHTAQLAPEERLHQIHERLIFVQQYTRELPPSVRAELDANPRMQATLAHMRQRLGTPQKGETSPAVSVGEDGIAPEQFPDPSPSDDCTIIEVGEPSAPQADDEDHSHTACHSEGDLLACHS
jgi:hypothetical protein